MKIIWTILLVVFFSCSNSQKHTITFINQSKVEIDSVRIGISSADVYTFKLLNVGTSDTATAVIPCDKPKSNKHDITMFVSIYIKNNKMIYDFDYDDLGGYLSDDYTIIFNGKEVEWKLNK